MNTLVRVAATMLLCAGSSVEVEHDRRWQPISREELTASIRNTPMNSVMHEVLIGRAIASRLAEVAEAEYSAMVRKHPESALANLHTGQAALATLEQGPMSGGKSQVALPKQEYLFNTARSSLSKAAKLDPKLAAAAREYGYFLWQYEHDPTKGIEFAKKAVTLDALDPVGHLVLGYMYFNQSTKFYDPARAEEELLTAVRLDPLYASPHRLLAGLFKDQRRPQTEKADRELRAFLALVPPEAERRTIWLNHH